MLVAFKKMKKVRGLRHYVKNISYFCNVKLIRTFISVLAISVLCMIPNAVSAAVIDTEKPIVDFDDLEISLLTCAPGQEVYSLYGHTALRIRQTDVQGGVDIAVNYGMFSFHKPFFVLRFIFGVTDYEMGIVPFNYFCEEYRAAGRSVIQQTLNLTTKEKEAVWNAVMLNFRPENRVYRYNYFYDNCTTRARDIVINNIDGKVKYDAAYAAEEYGLEPSLVTEDDNTASVYPSYRELIHQMNCDSRWARFGNDMLLGVKADKMTDLAEQQFLPFNLKRDFDKAKVVDENGHARSLLTSSSCVVDVTPIVSTAGFLLTPAACAWILFVVTLLLTIIEWRLKGTFWLFDTLLLIVTGCAGLILFLMLFSLHPTTSTNLQILLLNPLSLVFVWRVTGNMRKKRADRFWQLAVLFIVLFLLGGILQEYAEGMYVVALSLLLRCVRRLDVFLNTKER